MCDGSFRGRPTERLPAMQGIGNYRELHEAHLMNKAYWSILIVLGIATVIATIKAESDHRREQRELEHLRRIANSQQEGWL